MDSTVEEKVSILKGMGFIEESTIRHALELAKNDLNEAVSYLTCEMPMSSYDVMNDVEMNDIAAASSDKLTPCYPPTYEETMIGKDSELHRQTEEDRIDFPYECLVELEGRVFTENWSIPFRKDESLAKCLASSTKLINEGLLNADENATKFLDRCMPECFNKLLTSSAVQKWLSDVQEGIYDMLSLFIDLLIARLKHPPLPLPMLQILSTAFNPDCCWNVKNKYRTWQQSQWVAKLGGLDKCYARPPEDERPSLRMVEQRGWMVSLINEFCEKGGLSEIEAFMKRTSNLDAEQFAALLQPFSVCADWLNQSRVQSTVAPIIERAVTYVRELSDEEFKLKKLSSLGELLNAMKGVCRVMWAKDVTFVDDLRLEITLRMMKCPHFNAKMNALKEVTRLIEESKLYVNDSNLDRERLLEWLVDNNILRISLEGHIDQSQYCDKIRTVVQFIGDKLNGDELTQLWNLQSNASLPVSENVQSIISGAATHFTSEQLDILFRLIHKSWLKDDEKARQQLVSFIGRIGHDSRQGKEVEKVLTLLWDLAHLPKLSPHLVELALREHNSILSDAYLIKDALKKQFIVRCIEDIKKDQWVVPALRQFQEISKTIIKHKTNKSDRTFLHDLNKAHELLKLAVNSMARCHQAAVESSRNQGSELNGNTLVDERYKHSEYVWYHLDFLKFLLKDGDLYLNWNRAKDVWDILFTNRDACSEDRETCCNWFARVLTDLEHEAIKMLFRERLTKIDVTMIDQCLFECFIKFFESANVIELKMKKSLSPSVIVVEKLDLIGINFLWRVCLECQSNAVAESAISCLVSYSYINVSQKLKKDVAQLHFKFLNECYRRLSSCNTVDNGMTVAHAVNIVTKPLTATVPDVVLLARRPNHHLAIERLLTVAWTYISNIEASYTESRTLLPHGEFFRGSPITLDVRPETIKSAFTIETHGNESIRFIRRKIANELDVLADYVQILVNERVIPISSDRLLLGNCDFSGHQIVVVKLMSSVTQSMQIDDEVSLKNNVLVEMEQRLPSVVAISKLGNRVFDILFQLSDLDQSQITNCVRNLLLLLPTDPRVKQSIESAGQEPDNNSIVSDNTVSDSSVSMEADEPPEGVIIERSPVRKPRSFDTLFRVCSPDMNLFRLRYNLEVLSGLLIPVNEEQLRTSLEDCASFMHNFIQVGGIQTILNVLQREIVSESVEQFGDAATRRGCYGVALDIAKHLLCVAFFAEHTPGCIHGSKLASIGSEVAVSPLKRDSFRVGSFDASATPTKRNRRSVSQSPVVISQEIPNAAKTAVQVMSSDEFSSLIITLVRITWFASACKLDQLTFGFDPSLESGTSFLKGRRWSRESTSSSALSPFRQASTSSVSSAGSAEPMDAPTPGRSHDESLDKSADSLIAQQALELLVSCLKLRSSHLECFFDLPYVSEFIIDILTRPVDSQVRECAVDQLYNLSTITSPMVRSARQRLIQLLAKARVPYWNPSTLLRPKAQSLVRNCLQFFALKCNLLSDCISANEQKTCGVDETASLEEEVSWLNNFEIPTSAQYAESPSARFLDNVLLTGHLRFIKTLISSPKVIKKEIGFQLIGRILSEFLFPASKLILDASNQGRYQQSITSYQPKCSSDASRSAAFEVLIELCRECTENLSLVSNQLISMHHYPDQTRAKEFDFAPLVSERPEHGFVGLKNGGATCYMNSVLQQLYMVPDITQLVLSTEVENETARENTVLYQLQKVFAHLHHSRLQFHIPSSFWKTFRLWGQEINVREQQDAFEFFTDLTDQIDEYLKAKELKGIFKDVLRGLFCDQKICEGCPHKFEREEPYFALNLPVKSGSLEDSLRQFIAGEKLEGDNAYFCEKCNGKRTATKRTCIKSLPPVLTIQLKRFGYDWEAGTSLKFDHHFRFPHEVDMQPYLHDSGPRSGRPRQSGERQLYRLVGVVIHSGQAQAGHYYSIIKDRRGTPITNPYHGRWYKFNDTIVEEFLMTEQSLEEECFGGTFTSKVYERGVPYDEERVRYWNAYLLFYERVPDASSHVKGRVSFVKQAQVINSGLSSPEISPPTSPRKVNDIKLSQLTNLIKKGDQRGIFTSQIPSSIMHLVREENLQFMRNRGIYSPDYFKFILLLVQANLHCVANFPAIAVTSLQLAMQFLFRTYFRTKRSMLTGCDEWEETVAAVFHASPPACVWFATQLKSPNGMAHVVTFLLECPNEVVRSCFAKMLGKVLRCLVAPNISKEQQNVSLEPVLSSLLALLDKEATEHVRRSKEYFGLVADFAASQSSACRALLRHRGLSLLLRFLLGASATAPLFPAEGKPGQDGSGDATAERADDDDDDNHDVVTRRWSSTQSREFHALHASIISILLQLNLKKFRSGPDMSQTPPPSPISIRLKAVVKPTHSVEKILTGSVRKRYIRELLFAAREISTAATMINEAILHCCYNNADFSSCAISIICHEISSLSTSELKPVLSVMLELLSLEDALHLTRLKDALERPQRGFLEVIKEARDYEPKCYQCVKALVQLASRCESNRQFMLESSSNWSWSVTWLKKKMSEHTWSQPSRSNDSSTSKHFQRTMSAQNTLDQATALLAATKNSLLVEDDDTTSSL